MTCKVPVKKMASWTLDEVCNWLSNLNLDQYCQIFRENEIDGTELFNINAETLANDLCIGMFYIVIIFCNTVTSFVKAG